MQNFCLGGCFFQREEISMVTHLYNTSIQLPPPSSSLCYFRLKMEYITYYIKYNLEALVHTTFFSATKTIVCSSSLTATILARPLS